MLCFPVTIGCGATVGGSAGVVTYFGSGTELSGIVTSITAGNNISVSGATGNVTITGLANTANITAEQLVVTGVSTFQGNAIFDGNVTIGGTLTYEDVNSIDSVGFITAREGVHVGFDYDGGTGIGATLLPSGNAVFAGIVTAPTIRSTTITATSRLGVNTDNPLNAIQVGTAASAFTVVSTATSAQLGIGTTSPDYTLDVRGDTNIDGKLTIKDNTVPSLAVVIALGGL